MVDRFALMAGIAISFALLAPGAALASVKCQCNNGSIVNAIGADYVDEEWNDACGTQGGGRVWSVDGDQDDDDTTRRDARPRTGANRGR